MSSVLWVAAASFTARVGDRIDEGALRDFLVRMGFTQSPTVTEPGDYAVRGGIIDIFPPGESGPIRLDLFGDVLDGARRFDAAEALRGARIFVPRSSFPSTSEDEFYWVDLIGLSVVNREGVALGQVQELMSTGPQTVLVLAYEQDGKAQERMIPFVSAFVDKVDLPEKRITVDWQPDY